MDRLFKVGDRVVARTYRRIVFEIVDLVEGSPANDYRVCNMFRIGAQLGAQPIRAQEGQIRLATQEEIANAVARRLIGD